MPWYTLILCLVSCSLTAAVVWQYAYRLGLQHGRSMLVPFPLIDELIEHRVSCLGHDPTTAQVEVETSLGLEE